MSLQEVRAKKKAERERWRKRHAESVAEAQRIVETGVCPECGARLRHNGAIAGWWQCGRYGADPFREEAYRGQAHCSFQCFTA